MMVDGWINGWQSGFGNNKFIFINKTMIMAKPEVKHLVAQQGS